MATKLWAAKEVKLLSDAYAEKPAYETENQLAERLVGKLKRSKESIRWQLRQFRSNRSIGVTHPKILIMDIETMPIEALVWSPWNQNVYMEQIKKDWSILCWSAKWLFESKVMGEVVTPEEAKAHEDRSVLDTMWNLLNEADMVVTHNGDKFDIKKLNWRFLVAGMPKPMYYKSIDTKKIAKMEFAATHNKLDWIAQIVGIGRKIETDFTWWKECEQGNEKYLNMMLKYNKQDVHLEEEVYLKLRPWMTNHPNLSLYNVDSDVPGCPACGGIDLDWSGKYATGLGLYRGFRCQTCGAIGRSTKKAYKLSSAVAQ